MTLPFERAQSTLTVFLLSALKLRNV